MRSFSSASFFPYPLDYAQTTLVENAIPRSRLILLNNHSEERTAALILQDFIKKISAAELPILANNESLRPR